MPGQPARQPPGSTGEHAGDGLPRFMEHGGFGLLPGRIVQLPPQVGEHLCDARTLPGLEPDPREGHFSPREVHAQSRLLTRQPGEWGDARQASA
jgi:hypothetical protein